MKNLILASLLISACGQLPKDDSLVDCQKDQSNQACEKDKKLGLVSITGSISGAFDVVVDGQHYSDIEAYYTAEVDRLATRVAKAGYEDYKAEFDAKLGSKDLTQGMTVFMIVSNGRGEAGKAYVGYDDTFFFRLPSATEDGSYRIKAVKRVSIVLTKDKEVKRFCFNFSALGQTEIIERKSEPVILSTFESSVTKYACSQLDESGLVIPNAK